MGMPNMPKPRGGPRPPGPGPGPGPMMGAPSAAPAAATKPKIARDAQFSCSKEPFKATLSDAFKILQILGAGDGEGPNPRRGEWLGGR